jgi:hypothetical protein
MRRLIPLILIVTVFGTRSFGQNQFPNLDTNALVNRIFDLDKLTKPYTLLIYGGVGCGYSKYLIENLDVLAECKDKCDIILIMDQAKDSINKHMPNIIEKYPTFTNTILQYRPRKKSDIFPQLLLFKNKMQIDHVLGIKEGMLTKTIRLIVEDK